MTSSRKIAHFKISLGSQNQTVSNIFSLIGMRHSSYVCVANVHMLVESYLNPPFRKIVDNAAIVTSDGKPLTWALRLLYGIKQERIAGMFLMQDLLEKAEAEGAPVFFYGSTPEVLATTKKYLDAYYPKLPVAGFHSPPFRTLTKEEEENDIKKINASGAKLVFVALGCPKQEKWMAEKQGKINAVMVGIGAALPVMVGLRKKAPMWIQNSGMEWLFRLCLEPKRLFKRYALTNSYFIYLLAKEFFKIRIQGRDQEIEVQEPVANLIFPKGSNPKRSGQTLKEIESPHEYIKDQGFEKPLKVSKMSST